MMVVCEDKIDLLDFNGKIIKTLDKKDDHETFEHNYFYYNYYNQYNNSIILIRKDGNLDAWDLMTDKIITSKGIDMSKGKDDTDNNRSMIFHPTSIPCILVHENKSDKLKIWNWKKNTVKELNINAYAYGRFSTAGKFIVGYRQKENTSSVWDLDGNKIIDFEGGQLSDGYGPIDFSKNDEHILVLTEEIKLYDKKGVLLRDFKKYNKKMQNVFFL